MPSDPLSNAYPQLFLHEWEWDASHTPLPLTPSFGSVYPRWMEAALKVTFREFGMLPAGIEMRLRNGYAYTRVQPAGVPVVPPSWLLRPALHLWWLHPIVSRRVYRSVRRFRDGHDATLLSRWERRWRPAVRAEQQALRSERLEGLSDDELADGIEHRMSRTGQWVTIHFLLHGAIAIALYRLERFLRRHKLDAQVRVADLVQGSSAASSAPARALAGLAAQLASQPRLLTRAAGLEPKAALALLRGASPSFDESFGRYLDRFGHGISGRYEFIVPALDERPEALIPTLLRHASDRFGGPTGAQAAANGLIEATIGRLRDGAKRERFVRLVAAARRAYGVRDDNVQITFVDAFGLDRRCLLAAGRRLVARGAVAEPDDIFFLTVPEAVRVLRQRVRIPPAMVERRRARWRAAIDSPPPAGFGRRIPIVSFEGLPAAARATNEAVIRYMREIMASPDVYPAPMSGGLEVRGMGAVGGRYSGVACVIQREEDFDRLRPGDVLVCTMTSPAWAPVLPLAGALVTDHGGMLSHPAVIAREFGIPAVVATRHGTAVIPDGAFVEVDGHEGVVRVLRRGESAAGGS
jgi:phosphohistidine swiveling domain-containing protein